MLTPKLLAVDSYAARQWTSPMMVSIVQMLMPFFFVSAIALARCPGLVLAVVVNMLLLLLGARSTLPDSLRAAIHRARILPRPLCK